MKHNRSQRVTISIVSISSPSASFKKRLERSLAQIEKLGFKYALAKHALEEDGYRVAHPQVVANDIQEAFYNPNIDKILISTGGMVGNNFLGYLNYEDIKNSNKPICGFSDATPLLLAIYAKTGNTTYHGPTLLPSFGDYEGINADTLSSFLKVFIQQQGHHYSIPDFPYMVASSQIWDLEDNRPQDIKKTNTRLIVRPGQCKGTLIGGNLNGIISLIGTEYLPRFKDTILFIEESGQSLAHFERSMYHLKHAGILTTISGLIVGKFTNSFMQKTKNSEIIRVLMETVNNEIPIIMDIACGHTKPMLTFPIGVDAEICQDGEIILHL